MGIFGERPKVEVPGVVLPCGHVYERPDPPPVTFNATCRDCGRKWQLIQEHGSWKAKEIK